MYSMADEDSTTPHVSYVYNTTSNSSTLGGPIFILLYIQCGMFLINQGMSLSMELWQLVFPTFLVASSIIIGLFNQLKS